MERQPLSFHEGVRVGQRFGVFGTPTLGTSLGNLLGQPAFASARKVDPKRARLIQQMGIE